MGEENLIMCKRILKIIMVFALAMTGCFFCYAAQTGDVKKIVFDIYMVQTTPCAINGDQPITVSFGNVGISKIDTGRYVQDLHYSLNCGGATSKDKVSMFIKANPTTWDTKAIATDVAGLGAQVLKDGSPVELNTYISITDPANPPSLQVRLVKDPAVTLTDRAFVATGTIIVEYL